MTFAELVDTFAEFIQSVVTVSIGIGLLLFLWGMVNFIFRASSSKAHTYGRDMMVWGLIALFVMVSIWGILGLAQNAFFD